MIEYDKANVTSSYPSLTKYEVATILDKAYLALIARKLTGNNTRRVPFEYDVKAIEDLRPLITSKVVNTSTAITTASNELAFKLPDDLLYYLEGQASYTNDNSEPADNKDHFNEIVNLVDHRTAQRFRATNTNMPWIKQPVSFLQGDDVYVLYDTYKHHDPLSLLVTYLEKPASFVASLVGTEDGPGGNPGGNEPGGDEPTQPTTQLSISIHRNDFEDDTKALIAATIVVENIEDQLYIDIFEKAETASQWTLLNTDTYDNNHTISWPVDITTYDKNVKFVIRNSNSTIKKESNVFTISSKPQTEATGNISRIQYNSTDQNIEALCQLYNTSGVVLKYYIKPISASNQAYVLYGSDAENFTTIIPYTEVWKYKNAERGFVYKVELIDKITDSVLDTKTIVVPVESSDQPSYNISTAVGYIESLYISPNDFNTITQDMRLGFVCRVAFSNTNSAVLKMYSGNIISNQQFEFQSDVKTFTKSGTFAQHNCLQPGLDYKFVLVDQNSGNILDAKIITIPYYNTLGGPNPYIRILCTYPGTTSAGDNTVAWELVGLDENLDNVEIGATGIDPENTSYNAYYNNNWTPNTRDTAFIHYSQSYNTDYMYMWARDKNTKEVLASSSLFVIPRKRMVVLWSSLPDDNSILKYSIFYCSKTAATFVVYYKTEGQNNWKELYSTNLTACSSKTNALWAAGDHIEIPLEQNLRSGVTFKAEIKQENTTISANITTI